VPFSPFPFSPFSSLFLLFLYHQKLHREGRSRGEKQKTEFMTTPLRPARGAPAEIDSEAQSLLFREMQKGW